MEHFGSALITFDPGTSQKVNDNILFTLGTDGDSVLVHNSAGLAANTALASVLIGTPVAQAIAANSLIVSNVTASGDIALYVNTGGHSQQLILLDGSAGTLILPKGCTLDGDATIANGKGIIAGYTARVVTAAGNTAMNQIHGTAWESSLLIANYRSSLNVPPQLQFLKSHVTTLGGDVLLIDNSEMGEVVWCGADGTNFATLGAKIRAIINGTPEANRMPTDLEFYTALGTGDDDIALKMTLTKAGVLNMETGGVFGVAGTQVVGARVVDARADDTVSTGAYDATTGGVIDALRDAMISHGLIAAA